MKVLLAFYSMVFLFVSCATSGGDQELVGEHTWQVYVWDGKICNPVHVGMDAPECTEKLRPQLEERAKVVCRGAVSEIKDCRNKRRTSGTRLFCTVKCSIGPGSPNSQVTH